MTANTTADGRQGQDHAKRDVDERDVRQQPVDHAHDEAEEAAPCARQEDQDRGQAEQEQAAQGGPHVGAPILLEGTHDPALDRGNPGKEGHDEEANRDQGQDVARTLE